MASNKRKIGAVIALDGESQFKKSVSACNASLKTMKSEMNLVTEQFKGQANSMDALKAKHEVLEKTLDKSVALQSELEKALENSQKNYASAGEQLDGYRRQLEEATSSLAKLEKQQVENADDSLTEQIKSQKEEMERLTSIVQRGEKAYAQAGNNVETWQQKLNDAKIQVVKLQREIDTNNGYMNEASKSADGCATSIDEMGRRIKESTTQTSGSVEKLTDDVENFFTVDKISEYADAVSEAFQQVAQSAYDALQDLDEGYDTILTKTGASGDALAEFTGIADKIYGDLPSTMSDIGTSIGEVNTRFGVTGDELDDLSRRFLKFSNINDTNLNASIDGVQSAMASFNVEAKDAGKVLDVMNRAGQNTGVSMDTLQASLLQNASAFREMDMDIYQSIDFVSKLEKSGLDTAQVMAGLKKAYQTSAREGKSFQDSLVDIQETLLNSEDSVSANKKAVDLFGKSYANIATAVKDGRLSFTNMSSSMTLLKDSTDSVNQTFDDSLDTWDSMTTAINSLKTIGGRMMSDIMDIANPAVEILADGLETVRDGLDSLPEPLRKTVSTVTLVGGSVGIVAPKLFSFAKTIQALKSANDATNLVGLAKGITGVGTASTVASAGTTAFSTSVKGLVTTLTPYVALIAGTCMVLKALNDADEEYLENLKKEDATLSVVMENATRYTEKLTEVKDAMSTALSDSDRELAEISAKKDIAQPLVESLEKLQKQSHLTDTDIQVMKRTTEELNSVYPDLNLSVNESTGSFEANGRAVNDLSEYLNDYSKTAERVAKEKHLTDLMEKKVEAEVDFEISKQNREELERKMDKELESVGLSFDEWQKKNGASKIMMGMNPFNGFRTAGFKEMYSEWLELVDAQNALNDEYIETEDRIKILRDEIGATDEALQKSTDGVEKQKESWTGAGEEVDRAAQKYVDLSVKMRQFDGDIQAVSESFKEEEEALKILFESTVALWDSTHSEIMSGLGNEVASLSDSMGKWQEYKNQVYDSISSVSSIFKEREADESKSWASMTNGLISNVNAYELWNANVNAILQSARYQNDEAFREIANRIMTSGIESADYLDAFVQNVNLSTTQAKDDIANFTNLSGETEAYASQMASLKSATEESLSGIANVFDATKTEAQRSLEELSTSLTEKAEEYTQYSDVAQSLVESERYKTDEGFRSMVNVLLQQGMAGAGVLSELWTAMEAGNGEVDTLLGSFQTFESAMSGFADVTASTEVALQGGMDNMVSIVDSAGESLKIAMMNDEILMASGLTGEHLSSAVDSAVSSAISKMQSAEAQQDAYSTGESVGQQYARGIQAGMDSVLDKKKIDSSKPVSKWDFNPQDTDRSKYPSVTNNMNLTVNQQRNGWWGEITDWIRKSLS